MIRSAAACDPFDSTHYAKTWRQKLLRAVQLAPRYYCWDLPRYLRQRRAAGLPAWDPAALWNPLRELRATRRPDFPLPSCYEEAIGQMAEEGVRFTLPPARVQGLAAAWWAARDAAGDVMECGTYRGATALFLAVLGRLSGVSQTVAMLDTFRGVGDVSSADVSRTGREYVAPPEHVTTIKRQALALHVADRIAIYEGLFSESFARQDLAARRFAFVHIDANLYRGTREACEFALPRMSPGGMIAFDDYNGVCDLGARLAIEAALTPLALRPGPLAGYSAFVRIQQAATECPSCSRRP